MKKVCHIALQIVLFLLRIVACNLCVTFLNVCYVSLGLYSSALRLQVLII